MVLGRLGWFLAPKKRGEHSLGGGSCLYDGGSWLLGFGVSSPVSMEHGSSLRSNGEGVRATLLSHLTLIVFPITRLMVSVCDDLRKMLIVVNCLSVRKVGNH